MVENTLFELFKPSEKFLEKWFLGKCGCRKLKLNDYFRNYFFHFKDIAKNIFSYSYNGNFEKELTNEIENRLFLFGKCGIVKDNNKLWAVDCNTYGQDRYGKPTHFNYCFRNGETSTTPIIINETGVLAQNTFDFYPTFFYVEQYAFQLAHIDTTIISELVNNRIIDILIAHDNNTAENIQKYLNDIYNGKFSHITDKLEEMEINRANNKSTHLQEYLYTKDRFLKDSYENFGVKKISEKRERMITLEVENSSDLMNLNLKEMLDCRIKMCEDIKRIFGIDIEVHTHLDLDNDGKIENENEFNGKVV